MEEHLVRKTYYEANLLKEAKTDIDPVRLLGELYLEEQKKDLSDLTYIRFAQGEVYYHNFDYETAIFKWENIHNELEPWAKKNIADAYMELGLFETAEDIYRSVSTESLVLNTEIALQLFTLYLEEDKSREADEMIKNAVVLNPDYPNVTSLAAAFFEKQQDWNSAVELAVNESIRTKSRNWFEKLQSYIEAGYTDNYMPAYFTGVLYELLGIDQQLFIKMFLSIWHIQRGQEGYLIWLADASQLIVQGEAAESLRSEELEGEFENTFIELLSGSYTLADIADLMPNILEAWVTISDKPSAPAALLAWNDVFPGDMSAGQVGKAEERITRRSGQSSPSQDSRYLYETVKRWAAGRQLQLDPKAEWLYKQLQDQPEKKVLLAGKDARDKASFIQLLMPGTAGPEKKKAPVFYRYSESSYENMISDRGVLPVTSSEGENSENVNEGIVECGVAHSFLKRHDVSLIDFPAIHMLQYNEEELVDCANASNGLLFILNTIEPFSADECELDLNLKEKANRLPIHFLLCKDESLSDEKVKEIAERIRNYFPRAQLITYSPSDGEQHQREILGSFIDHHFRGGNREDLAAKSLYFIRKMITNLLKQQTQHEKELAESIDYDEDLLSRLKGAIHQLYDLEEEKTTSVQHAYLTLREAIEKDLLTNIPKIIRESADILDENSDFRNIHHTLNDEMNRRIEEYLQHVTHPSYISALQEWIGFSEGELNGAQMTLIEWNDSFNDLLKNEELRLACDFQILADWQRDADRMTGTLQYEKENILLKRTPSQVLIKSAGKIFGVIPTNNSMMLNRYKTFIENENFDDTAHSITAKFFRQFELLEKAIPRDMSLFFREPFKVLKGTEGDIQQKVDGNRQSLDEMRANPQLFRDPIQLFEVRLRQMERVREKDGSRI